MGRTQGTWDEVLDHAKQRLAFLEETHGLRRRQEGRTPVTVLRYRGRQLGFEVGFEWREATVDLVVVRLSDGALPTGGYYMHEGRRIRRHLREVTAGSFPEETGQLREAYGLEDPDRYRRMKLQLDVYAEVLRAVAGDVLRRGHDVFAAPDPGGSRPGDRRLP